MKKKMLYISHINWGWIYQRPQIIAESLSTEYDITVVYPKSVIRKDGVFNKKDDIEYKRFITFPKYDKVALLDYIDYLINKAVVFRNIKSFDYIYLCHPVLFRYVPKDYTGTIIYDCMDDYTSLSPSLLYSRLCGKYESLIIKSGAIILASSLRLKNKIEKICGNSASVFLCRNGVSIYESENYDIDAPKKCDKYILAYFGTVSEWFDFDLLKEASETVKNVEYRIIGPADNRSDDDTFKYFAPVKHDELYNAIADCSCLIMPFKINDIVLSVDPVKLYEYIKFGKCIISVYYPEIERFSDFIYFYNDKQEYIDLLNFLVETGFPPKYSAAQRKAFLSENTWDERCNTIKDIIRENERQC